MANTRKCQHIIKHENYDLCRFAESSFGQKVWSTFPIAQCRVASPLKWRQCYLLLNEIKQI